MTRSTVRDRIDDAAWDNRFAAIEKEAAAILAAEGANHVRGVYFVSAGDAYMARMVEAEQRVAKRDESMDRYIAGARTVRAEMAVTGGLSDAQLAARMLQHTAMVCGMVTDAMGIKT